MKRLCKWRSLAEPLAFVVENVDGDCDQDTNASKNHRRIVEMALTTDVLVEWRGRKSEDTCKEIPRETIAACRRRRIRP